MREKGKSCIRQAIFVSWEQLLSSQEKAAVFNKPTHGLATLFPKPPRLKPFLSFHKIFPLRKSETASEIGSKNTNSEIEPRQVHAFLSTHLQSSYFFFNLTASMASRTISETREDKERTDTIPEDEAEPIIIVKPPTDTNNVTLKRARPAGFSLEELEEELVKRKKQKNEAWYDEHGKLICVSVSTIHGKHSFVVGDGVDLEALAP